MLALKRKIPFEIWVAPRRGRGAIRVSRGPKHRLQVRKARGYARHRGKPDRLTGIVHHRVRPNDGIVQELHSNLLRRSSDVLGRGCLRPVPGQYPSPEGAIRRPDAKHQQGVADGNASVAAGKEARSEGRNVSVGPKLSAERGTGPLLQR